MLLTDTGPLVGLLDAHDAEHGRCTAVAAQRLTEPFLTPWPCFTEAMYFLSKGGFTAQLKLWTLRKQGKLELHDLTTAETDRVAELMDNYQNVPMGLADASLIAVAESLKLKTIFTLDGDFHIYRLADGSALTVVP